MNVKKRLQKILDYVNDLEAENTFLDSKVAELEKPIFQAVNGYGKLIQFIDLERENARLREQLRWYDVGELPEKVKIGSSCISRAVILKEEKCIPKTAYFDYDNFMWVNLSTMKVIVLGYESKATWCYIPEDGDA